MGLSLGLIDCIRIKAGFQGFNSWIAYRQSQGFSVLSEAHRLHTDKVRVPGF